MSIKKGVILNRYKSTQVLDYSGVIRMRGITPTDIDGLIDYGGKSFIYLEGKTIGAILKTGQKMALENIVNSHNKANHSAVAIIFRHNTPINQDVIVSKCLVDLIYFNYEWVKQNKKITVLRFIERWEAKFI
jgi:hypothetical protein